MIVEALGSTGAKWTSVKRTVSSDGSETATGGPTAPLSPEAGGPEVAPSPAAPVPSGASTSNYVERLSPSKVASTRYVPGMSSPGLSPTE